MKKTLALALTAAMAISAIGASVSAATVTLHDKQNYWEQTATIKLEDKDVTNGSTLVTSSMTDKLPKLASNNIAKFVGWTTVSGDANSDDSSYKTASADKVKYKAGVKVADIASEIFTGAVTSGQTKTLYPIFVAYDNEKDREDTLNGDDDIGSDEKRTKALEDADKANGATDNVKKADGGVETKQATVVGDNANPNGVTPEGASDPFTGPEERKHLLKVCGLPDDEKGIIAYVYDVKAPDGLLSGKNARATLPVKTTSGMKVTLYHVVDAYKAVKVTGLNVGSKDVSFWANSFSPYVLVLTPSDSVAGTSTGNPGTGDFSAVPVALLAAAALGATGFVAYKKRKAE